MPFYYVYSLRKVNVGFCLVLVCCLCLFCTTSLAQRQHLPIGQDARLSKTVTLSASNIHLYELLKVLSESYGVDLRINPKELLSGVTLEVELQDTPLSDVMLNLTSLLSLQGYPLRWTIHKANPEPKYEIIPSAKYREMPIVFRKEAANRLKEQMDLMIQIAKVSPDERPQFIKQLTASMLNEGDDIAKQYLQPTDISLRYWDRIRFFDKLIPQESRQQLLEGNPIEIPISELTAEDKATLERTMGTGKQYVYKTESSGTTEARTNLEQSDLDALVQKGIAKVTTPHSLVFYLNDISTNQYRTYATVMAGYKYNTKRQGRSLFGIMGDGLRRRIYKRWVDFDGILSNPQKEDIEISTSGKINEAILQTDILKGLKHIKETTKISYLAILPDININDQEPLGKPKLLQLLKRYEKALPEYMYKWQGDTLLINYPTWYYGEIGGYSFLTLQELRDALNSKNLSKQLGGIFKVVNSLNQYQIAKLSRIYPFLQELSTWAPAQLFRRFPAILSLNGTTIDSTVIDYLKAEGIDLSRYPVDLKKSVVKIAINTHEWDGKSSVLIIFVAKDTLGKWIPVSALQLRSLSGSNQ